MTDSTVDMGPFPMTPDTVAVRPTRRFNAWRSRAALAGTIFLLAAIYLLLTEALGEWTYDATTLLAGVGIILYAVAVRRPGVRG